MPIAVTDDHRALADAVAAFAARCAPIAVTRAQEPTGETADTADTADSWRKLWPDLAGLGIFGVCVPEHAGQEPPGTVVDLAVMLEAAAFALVPGPVGPSALAALLLTAGANEAGEDNPPSVALDLAADLASGAICAAVSLGPGLSWRPGPDGAVVVHGTTGPVPGADSRGLAVLRADGDGGDELWFVLSPDTAGLGVQSVAASDFSVGAAVLVLDDVRVAPAAQLRNLDTARARDLAVTLAAAEAAGVARWCLGTAVEYAKVREQFGRPIGSFQAVKHLCAEMLARVELATAVAWDAACAAVSGDPGQLAVAAATAGAVALDAAVDTAKDCIQVLGGIGFTWEHDAHLYLRRALALRQAVGGSAPWRRRVTELTVGGQRRRLHVELDAPAERLRADVRAQIAGIAALAADEQRGALAAAGLLAPHWPAPYGRAAGASEQLVIDQELAGAGVARPDLVIGAWAVPTILQYGTPDQIERFAAATLRGEITWCQLFSEPGAGSDLAALRTRAVPDDGGWRLSGQKVWTSVAQQADWGICLARTDPDAPKHKGISYFLVDMRSAGLDIRPLREITGEALFNEVFLDDVFVPDELRVGAVNDGWRLARATLVNERVAMGGGSSIGDAVEKLVAAAMSSGAVADPSIAEHLGRLIAAGLAGSVLELRSTLRLIDGLDAGPESSVRKLVGVRHRQDVAEFGLELAGPAGLLRGEAEHAFLQTRCLTIAGGTTQILLSLVAERILGLPRE